ncbi:hypothetical protein [Sphingobacterium sp. MYb382]|uniref:hypothetical protein n=1 Tax=Sphingobacterium sp. MYb382 TaxID=2745278 RepID=UPI0030AA6478
MRKVLLLILLFATCLSGYSQKIKKDQIIESPSDSLFTLFVKDIYKAVQQNAARQKKHAFVSNKWPNYVFLSVAPMNISLESLNKYNLYDFESISIKFDQPWSLYGAGVHFGTVILFPKNKLK